MPVDKPAYAPPAVTAAGEPHTPPSGQPPPPPPPPRPSAAERTAAWAARRPLVLRVLAVLAAQALAALTVGLAVGLTPPARSYVRSHGWPVGAAGVAAVAAWLALALVQARPAGPGAARARAPLLAAFSAALALFLGTLAARLPPAAAITAAVGVGGLVLAAVLAAAAGLDLTRPAAWASAAAWAVLLTTAATAWVAVRDPGGRWWITLLAGIGVMCVAAWLAVDVQALAGFGPLAGGGRAGWRGGVNRPAHLAADDWVGGAAALATDVVLGFVGVAALATGGRL